MKKYTAPIIDFLVGCTIFFVLTALPNRSSSILEFVAFFYPQSIGFLPVVVVVLRLGARLVLGRTLGETIINKEKRKPSLPEAIQILRFELLFASAIFLVETMPETLSLAEMLGISIKMPLSAYIQAPGLILSLLVIPISLAFYLIIVPRNQ